MFFFSHGKRNINTLTNQSKFAKHLNLLVLTWFGYESTSRREQLSLILEN